MAISLVTVTSLLFWLDTILDFFLTFKYNSTLGLPECMAANSNNSKNTKNKSCGHQSRNGSETLRMDDTGEEDDMAVGWKQIEGRSGKKESKK